MFDRTSRRALVVLVGTLALTRCSGGNDVVGIGTGRSSNPQTPTAVAATPEARPTPRVTPTPRPCDPRHYDQCGSPD